MATKPTALHVGLEVRANMARNQVTQSALAHALDLSQAAVYRRLTGQVPFNVEELATVADHLGVTVVELLAEPKSVAA